MVNFKVSNSEISDVKIFEPIVFEDKRGYFFESFNQKAFNDAVGSNIEFVQDNQSYSKFGVIRGLHKQSNPYEQAKLVRVLSGEIFDVAVDVRKDSPTYGRWVGYYLSSDNKKQLWIPEGFLHGFVVTSEYANVLYKTNNFYSKDHEISISWNDEFINIDWPINKKDVLISKKDLIAPTIEILN